MIITPQCGLKNYVTLAVSLAFCCCMISMLPSVGDEGFTLNMPEVTVDDTSAVLRQMIIDETVKKICETVKMDVSDKYSLGDDEITVSLDRTNGEEIVINRIYIELYGGRNMMKLTGIQYYVTEKYSIECTAVFIER